MEEPNFWDDAEKASASMKEVKDLKSVVERADGLSQEYEDILTLIAMGNEEEDASLIPEVEQEYKNFCQDMKKAANVVYITDNCGEIVLDKIAIQILKKIFPNIRITALVRGLPAGNDATMEDAEFCGLTDVVPVLGNGNDVGGTWLHGISTHAR